MTKVYAAASGDVESRVAQLRELHYAELLTVTIGALFVFDDEDDAPVLMHQGYPASAVARIVGLRDRAAGMPDAMIVIDRSTWASLEARAKNALLDHELHHITRAVDGNGVPKRDALGRPKLTMRKHDWQLGWFDAIANRHGEYSHEVMSARLLLEQSGQLYFDFTAESPPAPKRTKRKAKEEGDRPTAN